MMEGQRLFFRITAAAFPPLICRISSSASIVETIPEIVPPADRGWAWRSQKRWWKPTEAASRWPALLGRGTRMTVEFPVPEQMPKRT